MNGRGYAAAYKHLESIAQSFESSNSQQRSQFSNSNNPCLPGYNPGLSTPYSSAHKAAPAVAATTASHHALLLASVNAYNPSTILNSHVSIAAGPSIAVNYSAAAPVVYSPHPTAHQPQTATSPGVGFSLSAFDPLPLALAPAVNHHASHQRMSSFDEFLMLNPGILSDLDPHSVTDNTSASTSMSASSHPLHMSYNPPRDERWLEELKLQVPGLSLDSMTGTQVVTLLRSRMDDVVTRYLPCVDFLVQCQQELRKGLQLAQKQRTHNRRYAMSGTDFFNQFIVNLPNQFHLKNQFFMEPKARQEAVEGLHKLVGDSRKAIPLGYETIKNQFLGGMKDGESWGLRRWLSTNGNALYICTDVECILQACNKMEKNETSCKLAEILRPLAKQTLDRLNSDIPKSYQEHSSAHPFLPFFHRLESALRGMSHFDPSDDGVVVLDDSDDEDEPDPKPLPPPKRRKRPADAIDMAGSAKRPSVALPSSPQPPPQAVAPGANNNTKNGDDDASSSGESDDESVIEIVDVKASAAPITAKPAPALLEADNDWQCTTCMKLNDAAFELCFRCGEPNGFDFFRQLEEIAVGAKATHNNNNDDDSSLMDKFPTPEWPVPLVDEEQLVTKALAMANNLDRLAVLFQQGRQASIRGSAPVMHFWDGSVYAEALMLFASIVRRSESLHLINCVDEDVLIRSGGPPYTHVIKHPLCFRDIVAALIAEPDNDDDYLTGMSGRLPGRVLSAWNMWKGTEFLQAIDLVFLNTMAYGKALGEGKSAFRSATNKLRKFLWNGINRILVANTDDAERRKLYTPVRRADTSGFVVYKIQER